MTMSHKEAISLAFRAGLDVSAEGVCYDLQNRIAEAIVKKYLEVCGLVVVPREPTDAMLDAGDNVGTYETTPAVWEAMLAAAPDPFGGE